MMLSHNSLAVIHARTNSRTSSAVTRFGGLDFPYLLGAFPSAAVGGDFGLESRYEVWIVWAKDGDSAAIGGDDFGVRFHSTSLSLAADHAAMNCMKVERAAGLLK